MYNDLTTRLIVLENTKKVIVILFYGLHQITKLLKYESCQKCYCIYESFNKMVFNQNYKKLTEFEHTDGIYLSH